MDIILLDITNVPVISKLHDWVIVIGILIGAGWVVYKYFQEKYRISFDVKIEGLESYIHLKPDGYLAMQVNVKNSGNADIELNYEEAKLSIAKTFMSLSDSVIKGERTDKTGVTSFRKYSRGRLRSGVSMRMPYWMPLEGEGLYFIEFEIEVDLMEYAPLRKCQNCFCLLLAKKGGSWEKSLKIKRYRAWSDRLFYEVKNDCKTNR